MKKLLLICLAALPWAPALAQYQASVPYQGYQYSRPQFIPTTSTLQYQPAPYSPYFPNQQINPSQPGTSSMPPGQYTLTNLSTGQAIYVTITPQGQMYTGGPAPGTSTIQPSQPLQQPQSKFGFLKGLLQDGIGAASSMGY